MADNLPTGAIPPGAELLDRLEHARMRAVDRAADAGEGYAEFLADEIAKAGLEIRSTGPTGGVEVVVREYDAYGQTGEVSKFAPDEALRLANGAASTVVARLAREAFAELVR